MWTLSCYKVKFIPTKDKFYVIYIIYAIAKL